MDGLDPTHPDFDAWRKYFRGNLNLLWAPHVAIRTYAIMLRANELRAPIEAEYARPDVQFELYSWVDNSTDNVLMKAYLRDNMGGAVEDRGPEYAAGLAVTRSQIRDLDDAELDAVIESNWTRLAAAVWERPEEYKKDGGAETIIVQSSRKSDAGAMSA